MRVKGRKRIHVPSSCVKGTEREREAKRLSRDENQGTSDSRLQLSLPLMRECVKRLLLLMLQQQQSPLIRSLAR